jgi:hypothetical protein
VALAPSASAAGGESLAYPVTEAAGSFVQVKRELVPIRFGEAGTVRELLPLLGGRVGGACFSLSST